VERKILLKVKLYLALKKLDHIILFHVINTSLAAVANSCITKLQIHPSIHHVFRITEQGSSSSPPTTIIIKDKLKQMT